MRVLPSGVLLISVITSQALAQIDAFGPGFHRGHPLIDVPFQVVLEVNGEEFHVDVPDARARMFATLDAGDEIVDLQIDSRRFGGRHHRWLSNDVVDFRQEVDGALINVRILPLRVALGADPRLYVKSKVDLHGEWIMGTIQDHFSFDVPMTADSVTRLDRHHWEISGASGPRTRFEPPYSLLSGMVGGRQYDVSIRELGFGDWPDVVVTNVPEPSSCALGVLCVMAVGTRSWRKRSRLASRNRA